MPALAARFFETYSRIFACGTGLAPTVTLVSVAAVVAPPVVAALVVAAGLLPQAVSALLACALGA